MLEDKFKKVRKSSKKASPLLDAVLNEDSLEKSKGGRPREFEEELKKMQILVPESLKDDYKKATKQNGVTLSEPLRKFMAEYVEKYLND